MDKAASWTHNPTEGSVSGYLITQPNRLGWAQVMTVTAFIKDSSKRRWRIMAHAEMATRLLACEIGDRIKLTGIKGDLCQGAWDNAKRQIVPYSGRLMIGRDGVAALWRQVVSKS
jgi:hypothetical protein